MRIQVGQRLVEQKRARISDDRAAQRDTLLLSTGQLRRPSIEERYGSRDAYVAKVNAAADALVRERLLLPADAAAYVRAAEAIDRF